MPSRFATGGQSPLLCFVVFVNFVVSSTEENQTTKLTKATKQRSVRLKVEARPLVHRSPPVVNLRSFASWSS